MASSALQEALMDLEKLVPRANLDEFKVIAERLQGLELRAAADGDGKALVCCVGKDAAASLRETLR